MLLFMCDYAIFYAPIMPVYAHVYARDCANYCAHMHCDVDLRSRRMWAASYRLTRLVMYESSELLESFCTGHARVRAERGGDGGDGAVADAPVLGRRCCCSCTSSLGG